MTVATIFKKFLKKENTLQPKKELEVKESELNWIEASENPWKVKLLDLRPITLRMRSSSQDSKMAKNAISYHSEDGTAFINQNPASTAEIKVKISFPIDPILAPGALFIPNAMEKKWAIFFHQDKIIFVRSWLRTVVVIAETSQQDNMLYINKIKGQFSDDDEPEFTRETLKFLLISHVLGEIAPTPLPDLLSSDLDGAAFWAFAMYGNMAHIGIFTSNLESSVLSTRQSELPIRSHSLLHIAAAKNDVEQISLQVEKGIPVNILATDGLAPLHWSLLSEDLEAMQQLIKLGADPNVRSNEGTTPIMKAVESNRLHHLSSLLSCGADVNACDNRGFTSLHRAVEMGYAEIVKILLKNGANPIVEAEGHTPISLAKIRRQKEIVNLLQG